MAAPGQARRRSGPVFTGLAILAAALAGELVWAALATSASRARLTAEGALVASLGLTDPALFTGARYARNPTLADLNTPFQDAPGGFDHFPTGSVVPAPDLPASGTLFFGHQEDTR